MLTFFKNLWERIYFYKNFAPKLIVLKIDDRYVGFYVYFCHKLNCLFLKISNFFSNWILSTNHRRIALMYFIFTIISGFTGLILATIIRIELAYPGQSILLNNAEKYLTIISLHGIVMVFFMIIPIIFGAFGNFLLPTQLGIRDVAFPRLNSFMFWVTPSGFVMLLHIILFDKSYNLTYWLNYSELRFQLRKRFYLTKEEFAEYRNFSDGSLLSIRLKKSDKNFFNLRNKILHETDNDFYGDKIYSNFLTNLNFNNVTLLIDSLKYYMLWYSFLIFYCTEFFIKIEYFTIMGDIVAQNSKNTVLTGQFNQTPILYFKNLYLDYVYVPFILFFLQYDLFINKLSLYIFYDFIFVFSLFINNFIQEIFNNYILFQINAHLLFFEIFYDNSFIKNNDLSFLKFYNIYKISILDKNELFFFNNFIFNFIFNLNFFSTYYFTLIEFIFIYLFFFEFFINTTIEDIVFFMNTLYQSLIIMFYSFINNSISSKNKVNYISNFYYSYNNYNYNFLNENFNFMASQYNIYSFLNVNSLNFLNKFYLSIKNYSNFENTFELYFSENYEINNFNTSEFFSNYQNFSNFQFNNYRNFTKEVLDLLIFKKNNFINDLINLIFFYVNCLVFSLTIIHENIFDYLSLILFNFDFILYFFFYIDSFLFWFWFYFDFINLFIEYVEFTLYFNTKSINSISSFIDINALSNFFYFISYFFNSNIFFNEIFFIFNFKSSDINFVNNNLLNNFINSLLNSYVLLYINIFLFYFKNIFLSITFIFKYFFSFSELNIFNSLSFLFDYKYPSIIEDMFNGSFDEKSNWNWKNALNDIMLLIILSNYSNHSIDYSKDTKVSLNFIIDRVKNSNIILTEINLPTIDLVKKYEENSKLIDIAGLEFSNFKFIVSSKNIRLLIDSYSKLLINLDFFLDWRELRLEREVWRSVDDLSIARRHWQLRKKYFSNFYEPETLISKVSIWLPNHLIPGWAFITPYSSRLRYTALGKVDIALVVVLVASIGSVFSSVNYVITYKYIGSPIFKNRKELRSFFVDGLLVASRMMILANPALIIGIILLLSDRHFGTSVFDFSGGGDTILFQHLFWFFGHPEVYIIIIPCFGFMNSLLPYYLKKRLSGRLSLQFSMYTIAFMGFAVWGHHMYMVGLANSVRTLYSTMTVMISVPASTKVLHWCVTIINSTVSCDVGFLFLLSFMYFFVLGGLSGMFLAHIGFDVIFHDTFFVIGHFHVMLAGAAMSCVFAAFYFYFPAIFGVKYSRFFAYLHFTFYVSGQLLTLIPMFWLGYAGMPRRIMDYPSVFSGWHSIISSGHLLTFLSLIFFLLMIFDSIYENKAPSTKTRGVSRLNTRFSLYVYESRKLQLNKNKNLINQNSYIFNNKLNYKNLSKLELRNFEYIFLK